ncbi:hypothetical protein FEDK69T_17520 [Flavobacterium enshiense DK69]|nr:hypothetical protein FEDK69T_17520 [Flavobacterium enshiense DK69]
MGKSEQQIKNRISNLRFYSKQKPVKQNINTKKLSTITQSKTPKKAFYRI